MKTNKFEIPGRYVVNVPARGAGKAHAASLEEDNSRKAAQIQARKENKTPPPLDQLAALADTWGAKLKKERKHGV